MNRRFELGFLTALGVAIAVAGLLLATPAVVEAKTELGIGVGVGIGDFHVGTGTSLWLGYGRHSRHGSSWNVGVGYYDYPRYYYRAPSCSWYGYSPSGYGYYGHGYSRVSASYGRRHGHDRWRVSYNYYGRPYYSSYYGYPYGGYPGYGSVAVSGGYGWDHGSVGVGVAVPIGGQPVYRPSMSQAIVQSGPVERNPILKRVWVPGKYEPRQGSSGDRVWVPGYWDYVPDTE